MSVHDRIALDAVASIVREHVKLMQRGQSGESVQSMAARIISAADDFAYAAGLGDEDITKTVFIAVFTIRNMIRVIEKRAKLGDKLVGVDRPSPEKLDLVFQDGPRTGRKGPVPPEVKREMAEFARAGTTLDELTETYGYPASDLVAILKSAGLKAAEIPPKERPKPPVVVMKPQAPKVETRDLGIAGVGGDLELGIAERLEAGAPEEDVARATGATLEQIKAVRAAWKIDESMPLAAPAVAEAMASFQRTFVPRKRVATPAPVEDLTRLGEVLIYDGGPGNFRFEVEPSMLAKINADFEELRQTGRADKTEYDIFWPNLQLYAERKIPMTSTGRFKEFTWKGQWVRCIKGFQARFFFGKHKSVYPDGSVVERCGLLYCVLKKADSYRRPEVDYAVAIVDRWLSWRRAQDEKIAELMRKGGTGMRKNVGETFQPDLRASVGVAALKVIVQMQELVAKAMRQHGITEDFLASKLGLTDAMVRHVLESPTAKLEDVAALGVALGIDFQVSSKPSQT